MALNYGSRQEIAEAARRLARRGAGGAARSRRRSTRPCSPSSSSTAGIPDPDLLIRTSGEQRISNFLLWQLAYTELVFVPFSWPDFAEEHLREALREYHRRERRYGASAG